VTDVDAYMLPDGILGRHPEEFYGAIGRVVCVCAVLEGQITILRHTLANGPQGKFTHEPVSGQIRAARDLTKELKGDTARAIENFLQATEEGFARRNDLVHSAFPAQEDGRIWGHRPTRDRSVTDGSAVTVETSLDDLRLFVGHLAALVRSFNSIHALATTCARAESPRG
jgi:hypothetical protein